jgi:hypothetical protein
MRLSEFVAASNVPAAVSPKVLAAVRPVLVAIGAGEDPVGWFAAEDDPAARWAFLVPMAAGLVTCHVRVNVPGEGPRASARLVRWQRVQTGELSVESGGGSRRIISFVIDNRVVRATDAEGDAVAAFAHAVFDAMDGRIPEAPNRPRRADEASSGGGVAVQGSPSGLPELPSPTGR